MMREVRAARLVYDAKLDVLRVVCEHEAGAITSRRERVDGQLLLDAAGYLVGVDLGGEGFARTVVMAGPHEAVARTEPVSVDVVRDARGEGSVLEVAVTEARARARASEKNPYA